MGLPQRNVQVRSLFQKMHPQTSFAHENSACHKLFSLDINRASIMQIINLRNAYRTKGNKTTGKSEKEQS